VGAPLSVEVRDETTAGDTTNELFLRLESERLNVRDLVRARVYQEVREYNADARGLFRGLVQPTDAERERGGYRLKRRKQIDWKRQSEEACRAFEHGSILLLVERLLPKLRIADRCRIDGRFLRVEGKLRTYRIHLGSSNILMGPGDQYLCIVRDRVPAEQRAFLPFEGDATLALILSKAFLLADDEKIADPVILEQIRW